MLMKLRIFIAISRDNLSVSIKKSFAIRLFDLFNERMLLVNAK